MRTPLLTLSTLPHARRHSLVGSRTLLVLPDHLVAQPAARSADGYLVGAIGFGQGARQ